MEEEQSQDALAGGAWPKKAPPATPPSDLGEIEEARAALLGERYWAHVRTPRYDNVDGTARVCASAEGLSDDELAMSPLETTRLSLRKSSSLTSRRAKPTPSLRQPAIRSSSTTKESPAADGPSEEDELTAPEQLMQRKKRRTVSPPASDRSDDVLALVARKPRLAPAAESPLSSPSPSPPRASPRTETSREETSPASAESTRESPVPVIPPDPDPPPAPGGRSFRTRTIAQLKPFTTERTRYTRTLNKNGWEGAVVAPERGAVDETPEELKRRKEEQAKRPRNHLGGWLVSDEEEGDNATGSGAAQTGASRNEPTSVAEESLESEDGPTLLEREARRKERMEKAVSAAMGAAATRRYSPHRHGPSRLDRERSAIRRQSREGDNPGRHSKKRSSRGPATGSETDQEGHQGRRRRQMRAESAPASGSPATSPQKSRSRKQTGVRRSGAGGTKQGGGHSRGSKSVRRTRADSEPPTSSPGRSDLAVVTHRQGRVAKPAKSLRARKSTQGRAVLDQDILNLPVMARSSEDEDEDESIGSSPRHRSDGESDQPSTDDDEPDEYALRPEDLGPARLKLGGKRKRFLGAMMPGAFIKRAEADLRLMAQEVNLSDFSDGSEINSGDEEALERAKQRNLAKKRINPELRDGPLRFNGDAFTDESGTDSNRSDDGLDAAQDAEDENDAVASWLQSFAPQRAQGGHEDIVDRFLKRARRPQKSKRPGPKRKGPGLDGSRDRQGGCGPAQKKSKRKSAATAAGDVFVVEGSRPHRDLPAPKRRSRAIALDTDDAIFAAAGLGAAEADADDEEVEIVASRRRQSEPAEGAGAVRALPDVPAVPIDDGDHESWAAYGRFTYDFDLRRLPAGVRIDRPDSFVSNGFLSSLVGKSPASTPFFSCDVFGLTLSPDDDAETLSAILPSIMDGIYDVLSSLTAGSAHEGAEGAIPLSTQFLARWVASSTEEALVVIAKALDFHFDRVEARVADLKVPPTFTKRYRAALVELEWYRLAILAEASKRGYASPVDRTRRQVAMVVSRLLEYGPERTVKTLETASESSTSPVSDPNLEVWLGLVSLASIGSAADGLALQPDDLWTIVREQVDATLPPRARRSPVRGEIHSYVAVLLSAISQFTPQGVSTSKPSFPSHWPVVLDSLEAISPTALAKSEYALSSTAVARRDRYLWTLFARSLVFTQRWGWQVDVKDDLLARLAQILGARRFADLTTETSGDFPAFVQDVVSFDKLPDIDPKDDTAFVVFLRIVIAAASRLPAVTEGDLRKRGTQLTRLFLRISPMVSAAWTRQSPELTKGPSILTNHLSLYIVFALLHPSAATQRVDQARRLVSFAEVEEEARGNCIRAALYFALAFRHRDLPLNPVLDWLSDMVSVLKTEYAAIERKQRTQSRRQDLRSTGQGDPLWQRAVLITMALRSIQLVTRWRKPGDARPEYPDVALLRPAWTTRLLDTPLALDPMIGREAIKTIECFLDVRRAALSSPAPIPAAGPAGGESQDDYGGLDFDFDDPALNALLGVDGSPGDPQQELRKQDKVVAELLKSSLVPAFFRLVSNILADYSSSGPTVTDRVSYAQSVVATWVRCLAVAVENGIADWKPYLQYGDQSWKRLSDPVGRRDIGLFLVTEMVTLDPTTYLTFSAEMLEIWLDSLVARRLTAQHTLTAAILNGEPPCPLLDGLPFERSADTGLFEVEQLDLLDRRVEVLTRVFSNAARFAGPATSAHQPPPPSTAQLLHRPGAEPLRPSMTRAQVMNLLRSMLAAMRDNLGALRDESSRRQYGALIRSVLTALVAAGSTAPGPAGLPGRRGPFDEISLPDIKTLRALTA